MLIDIKSCIECPAHRVEADPDPDDWFCDDDVKVRCADAKDQKQKTTERGHIKTGEPYITVACRPYNTEKECEIPDWCPRRAK